MTTTLPMVDSEAGVIHVSRPADGSLIEDIPIDTPAHVADTCARLRAAQPAWEALPFAERAGWMAQMRDWLLENQAHIVAAMQEEAGKVRAESALELGWVSDIINYYSKVGPKLLGDEAVGAHLPLLKAKRFSVVRRPHPLVGVIGPWNFPVVLTFGDAVAALLAGAAVVIKPSEVTPLSLREVVRGWGEIGAPPVLDVVYGGAETGGAVVDGVDMVHFTGSVATGKKVGQRAMETVTPVSLELGGKDPVIVLKDADMERAVNGVAWGGFVNCGQVCVSLERAYVEEPVYDEFVARLSEKVRGLRQGTDGPDVGVDVGAMISPTQIAIVEDHVADARKKGARIVCGGDRVERDGDWYAPTIIADADHSMKVMREETFGPVLPIMKVRDEEEAIRMANDSEFGLAASVFCGSAAHGERIARRLEAGTVNVNDALVAPMCIDVPMGGWKASGIGARNGPYGMLKYTRAMTVCSPRLPTLSDEIAWFPYTPRKTAIFEGLYRFFNARGRGRLGR